LLPDAPVFEHARRLKAISAMLAAAAAPDRTGTRRRRLPVALTAPSAGGFAAMAASCLPGRG
jgi:hypothetical protein